MWKQSIQMANGLLYCSTLMEELRFRCMRASYGLNANIEIYLF